MAERREDNTLPEGAPPPWEAELTLPEQEYDPRGLLGRGGCGEVVRVFDNRLRREVALKRLTTNPRNFSGAIESFWAEARVTSQLEHPHIVPVHAMGVDGSATPYFTMKAVDGLTLTRWLAARDAVDQPSVVLADALDVLLKVCDALSLAHARDIAHCDIKPANIMIGAHGQVYLMDWGIAQTVGSLAKLAGTPSFMPPEVASGGRLSAATDVFAVGAVLYYILARRPPYHAANVVDALAQVRASVWTEPVTPSGRPPPAGLIEILRRAMDPDPGRRYANAGELAKSLRAFLRGGQHLPEQVFAAGSWVLRQGDPGAEAYIIVSGQARAWRDVQGVPTALRDMGPGEVFGEYAILSSRPRSASVEAVTELRVLAIGREQLEAGLGMHSWVGTVVRAIADRFAELEARVHGSGLPAR